MGKGQELADRFEQVNNEFISAVEGIPEDKWNNMSEQDGRQLNVVAHHVASSHSQIAGLVQAMASGGEVPQFTMDMINQGNDQHARDNTGATRDETLQMLRSGGQQAAQMLRSLTDEQLAKTGSMPAFGGQALPASAVVENVLIGHPQGHLGSITGG